MAVTCFGKSSGVFHIAPGGGFFDDGGMCLNSPIDASEYPQGNRLYIYGNVGGYSSPNIRTIFADGTDDVYYANSGSDYMWIYWNWGGYSGNVKFELRSGSTVRATRSTYIKQPDLPELVNGEIWCDTFDFRSSSTGTVPFKNQVRINLGINVNHSYIYKPGVTINGKYIPLKDTFSQDINYENPPTTGDAIEWSSGVGSKLHFVNITFDNPGTYTISAKYAFGCSSLVATANEAPVDPCEGVVCDPTCFGLDYHNTVCEEGICVQGSIIREDDPYCGYVPPDPCEGVVCEDTCAGYDLWSQKCVGGSCVYDTIIDADSYQCDYVPPDPCEGVLCDPTCFGLDYHNTVCEEGYCVIGTLIDANNEEICGYVPPEPEPDEDITDIIMNNKEIILGATIAGALLLKYT